MKNLQLQFCTIMSELINVFFIILSIYILLVFSVCQNLKIFLWCKFRLEFDDQLCVFTLVEEASSIDAACFYFFLFPFSKLKILKSFHGTESNVIYPKMKDFLADFMKKYQ